MLKRTRSLVASVLDCQEKTFIFKKETPYCPHCHNNTPEVTQLCLPETYVILCFGNVTDILVMWVTCNAVYFLISSALHIVRQFIIIVILGPLYYMAFINVYKYQRITSLNPI